MGSVLLAEPNILNVPCQDDFTKKITDFIYQNCNSPYIEIEAKIGTLLSKTTQQRISLPILTDTILASIPDVKFESAIPAECFQQLNKILNQRVQDFPGRVAYSHSREVDKFYEIPNIGHVRVTYSNDDIKQCLQKQRIADLNVFCPDSYFDFRLSINVENPIPKEEVLPHLESRSMRYSRIKDRLSYAHDVFRVDLTKVGDKNSTYEVEIELADMQAFTVEKEKAGRQVPNQFLHIVKALISNVRILSQRAAIRDGRLITRML